MPLFTGKSRIQESEGKVFGQFRADDARPENQHIDIVVLDALVCGVAIVAETGTNSGNLVGRHGSADATAADEDSALRLTTQDTSGHSFSKVRIVHRRRAV